MIFKNINSEDISGLIICSEPPISSSAIRTKETTIDGRDGAIVEKLGYKTRIRNVEIGLKKDANVDKILSYFSGEGDLIFKNENDKVYKAAIYEQVDLERLLRLRKGSVAFYCQPFKYKRNDIFETIKDNKVKEKKGKQLELLNCAEQNVVDLKLEGSTNQATRKGKNLLNIFDENWRVYYGTKQTDGSIKANVQGQYYITIQNTTDYWKNYIMQNKGKALTFSQKEIIDGYGVSIVIYGERTSTTNGYQTAECNSGGRYIYLTIADDFTSVSRVELRILRKQPPTTFTDTTTVISELQLEEGSIATDYEEYGVMPSPDYPSPIENVEGKNKFSGWVKGIAINSTDGHQLADETRASSDYIAVDFNQNPNYYLSSLANTLQTFVAAYNSNKEFLGRTGALLVSYFSLNSLSFTSGTAQGTGDIAYLRVTTYENTPAGATGKIDDIDNLKTQLEEGTAATDYVPPNSLEIKDIGKNIYNKRNVSGTLYKEVPINELLVGTYTLSAVVTSSDTDKTQCLVLDATNNKILGYLNRNVRSSFTFTLEKPTKKLNFYASTTYNLSNEDTFKFADIQIEQNTTATPYKPYQEQKIDFPLSEGQKLYKDSYLASDGIHYKRKQYTFTGNETVNITTYGNNKRFTVVPSSYNPSYKGQDTVGLCNYLKRDYMGTVGNAKLAQEPCFFVHSAGILITMTPDTNILDATQLKTWLSQNHVTVEYELATEEIVPYTTAQQEAYNQLQKLKLYKGQNTMFSLEGSIINLKYLEDTDEKIENQGNIYSKPIIRLEKTVFKEVEIAINGIRFKYNFEEDDYVEIDCEEMTVQYEGLDRNRRLVIDFEFPKLKEGNNDIVMYSGDCIIKCKRKDRWL